MPIVKYEKKKKYRNEKTAEEYKTEKEQLSKEIERIATNFSDNPEQLAELAAFQARFYNYSVRNTILIFSQNSGASFVGSFGKLKQIADDIAKENGNVDEYGNPQYMGVKSGAKAIKIFAPTPITYLNIDGNYVKISEATKEQKELYAAGEIKAVQRQAYKLVPVFDISQTLIPIEYYPQILSFAFGAKSKEAAEIFNELKEYIEVELDCPVKENIDNSISLRGRCYTSGDASIELNEKLNDTMRLSTLAHEFGHFLMHRIDNIEAGIEKPLSQQEVEADIFSIMLTSHFNFPTEESRKSHLAHSYRAYLDMQKENAKPFDSLSTIFSNASKVFADTIVGIEKYFAQEQSNEALFETEEGIEV